MQSAKVTMTDDRLPPHDVAAEEAVIGSLLLNGESISEIAGFLKSEHFFREKNAWIYESCLDLYQHGKSIDQVTVAHEMALKEKLEAIGGPAYLIHVLSVVPTSLHIKHYTEIVRSMALRRQLISVAGQIAAMGYNGAENAQGKAIDALIVLTSDRREVLSPKDWADSIFSEYTARNERGNVAVSYGLKDVDYMTGGLMPGELTIMGARPGMGKTSIIQQIATQSAKTGPVLFVSAEMTAVALGDRHVSAETGIDMRDLRRGKYSDSQWGLIQEAIGGLAGGSLWAFPGEGMTPNEIRAKASEVTARAGTLRLVVVDYLQILGDEGGETQNVRIGNISKGLKHLAKALNVPVLAASQLSRNLEYRSEKRPSLADLRDSGSLEQDADIVLFLYRDDYYYPTSEEWLKVHNGSYPKGIVEVIQAKHRQYGTHEIVKVRWQPDKMAYVDLAKA